MLTPSVQQQRAQLLQQMASIDSMIRGHLSQQTYQRKGAARVLTHGPYHLLQRHQNGKNNCQRIGPEELPFIAQAVEGHARFQELARRYAQLTEQATWERQTPEIKKKFRRFSRPTSPRPSSA
ncbi:MAG TPA: hypothetical protein PKX23_10530 [Verrucomicrobiota bacterium]|nr:hypothetical protein [Verrucomicrobiota bacterium]HRT08420.1 hypothetical protein [Candidatus Paceibacterota bacterium]HRT58001.1 hypothetical protein [Candidatus Paceibacterota bacterium]